METKKTSTHPFSKLACSLWLAKMTKMKTFNYFFVVRGILSIFIIFTILTIFTIQKGINLP